MLVLTALSKRIHNKGKKHEDTVRIARTYRSQVEAQVSKALKDDTIDETEFAEVVKCLCIYDDEKQQLLQPSTTFSEKLSKCAS